MLPKINPMETAAWNKLEEYYFGFEGTHMKEIFANDPDRFQKYSLKFEEILVDFSKKYYGRRRAENTGGTGR
jgi:glucose-6-phosphate isomerase